MRIATLSRYTLSSFALAMFAGCGGSQPPMGAPGAMPQTRAPATRGDSSNYKVIYSFSGSPDGGDSYASLIDVGGTLYGTTYAGGTSFDGGTVFSVTHSGAEKVLYSFGPSPDGYWPEAGLIDVSGTFYGTTSGGGSNTSVPACSGSGYVPCGTVFSVTPNGTETILHSFGNRKDGLDPGASLVDVNGTLYGTTQLGGTYRDKCNEGCGTVFSITPSGKEKILYSFSGGSDGGVPAASLIEVKGSLYGTTYQGGAYGVGTVFRITLSGKEKVLHSFGNGTDGVNPVAALTDVNGTLYGTTSVGGNLNSGHFCNHTDICGTVFSVTLSGKEKILHRFSGNPDGAYPLAGLINVNGTLYGTTELGGTYSCDSGGTCGTVFSITPRGKEKVLHSFANGSDGVDPAAALIDVKGTLYGTTRGGGTNHHGTVFAFTP